MSGFRAGFLLMLGANMLWGLMPVFWKLFDGVSTTEVLAHRTLWSFVFTVSLLFFAQGFAQVWQRMRDAKQFALLLLSALLISANWLAYIWAVNAGQVLASSMGYFLAPLLSVCCGVIFFREHLRRWQWLAVGIAALGVCVQIVVFGAVPWIGLFLAVTFAAYGAVRKKSACDSTSGLAAETLLLTPMAVAYMVWLALQERAQFLHVSLSLDTFFVLAGVVTALPLVLFVAASKRLALSTVGLMFYLTPTLQFLLGLYVYSEPVAVGEWLGFILIWIALVVFTLDGQRAEKKQAASPWRRRRA